MQPREGGCEETVLDLIRNDIGFNTQPPEGGCNHILKNQDLQKCFNTQPPEGGCGHTIDYNNPDPGVSTHSHPKVAARPGTSTPLSTDVSTHSHPKVAAQLLRAVGCKNGGFNTQPPEGGCMWLYVTIPSVFAVSTHSHPKVAAHYSVLISFLTSVSTHSHPKVAAIIIRS